MEIKGKIREYISKNKLDEALSIFGDWAVAQQDEESIRSISLLKARLETVKRQEIIGIITFSDSLKEKMTISDSILKLIDLAEASEKDQAKEASASSSPKIILFLASSPSDQAKLQLETEFRHIHDYLQDRPDKYRLVAEWATTPKALQEAILKYKPHFLHFSGHGEGGDEYDGGLLLETPHGEAKLVPGRALENLFKIIVKKFPIELVLLNACHSYDQAVFIQKHIPYVISMQDEIADESAIEFSAGFYRGLLNDEDIAFAYELAVNAIQLEGLVDEQVPILLKKETDA